MISTAIRVKLLSAFPFLRLTIPFSFFANKPLEHCVVLIQKMARPKTYWLGFSSDYLEVDIELVTEKAIRLLMRNGGHRRFFIELTGSMEFEDDNITLIHGEASGNLLYFLYSGIAAVAQGVGVVLLPTLQQYRSEFLLAIFLYWSMALTVTVFYQRRGIRYLIRSTKRDLNV